MPCAKRQAFSVTALFFDGDLVEGLCQVESTEVLRSCDVIEKVIDSGQRPTNGFQNFVEFNERMDHTYAVEAHLPVVLGDAQDSRPPRACRFLDQPFFQGLVDPLFQDCIIRVGLSVGSTYCWFRTWHYVDGGLESSHRFGLLRFENAAVLENEAFELQNRVAVDTVFPRLL